MRLHIEQLNCRKWENLVFWIGRVYAGRAEQKRRVRIESEWKQMACLLLLLLHTRKIYAYSLHYIAATHWTHEDDGKQRTVIRSNTQRHMLIRIHICTDTLTTCRCSTTAHSFANKKKHANIFFNMRSLCGHPSALPKRTEKSTNDDKDGDVGVYYTKTKTTNWCLFFKQVHRYLQLQPNNEPKCKEGTNNTKFNTRCLWRAYVP